MTDPRAMSASSGLCLGRDNLAQKILESAKRNGAVLLFGGRQAGKTTLLTHTQKLFGSTTVDSKMLAQLDIPIYVDLMRLPYDAKPVDFFLMLIHAACERCVIQINGFASPRIGIEYDKHDALGRFTEDLAVIQEACGEVEVHFIFLLDEAKRILGDRFPRGFQDNIFSLLFSGSERVISLVFAGAQHLDHLSEDDTSPIGSRAASHIIPNLTNETILSLCEARLNMNRDSITPLSNFLFSESGGQAGLATHLIEEVKSHTVGEANFPAISEAVYERNSGLLENWLSSLSNEAQAIATILSRTESLSIPDIAQHLASGKLNRFLARRVFDEFRYMGLAIAEGQRLVRVNTLFWRFFVALADANSNSSQSNPVWQLIEETELALRSLIEAKFSEEYDTKAELMMRSILGTNNWGAIQGVLAKSQTQYSRSPNSARRTLMSCMYLGDLQALLINGKSWSLFRHMFRDKRELEDIIKAITPVRNDRAHFSVVPEKELERCRIACDDLLVIIEKENDK